MALALNKPSGLHTEKCCCGIERKSSVIIVAANKDPVEEAGDSFAKATACPRLLVS